MKVQIVWLVALLSVAVLSQTASAEEKSTLSRWLTIDEATIASRFVWAQGTAGETNASQLQHQQTWKARLELIPGRLTVVSAAASGDQFTAGWNNTGAGPGKSGGAIFLKQLYVAARPVKAVEVQFGGLDFSRGFSTDVTSYHGQGFLTGQRAIVSAPERLFFDQVAFTYGYVGDYDKPGINKRFRRLDDGNYRQFLVAKRLGHYVQVSTDYTNHAGLRTLREAITVKPSRFVQKLQFEMYQRFDDAAAGLHLSGSRNLTSRLAIEGGFMSIDKNYGHLNNDAFFSGNRVYVGPALKIARGLSFFALLHHAVATDYSVPNRTFAHAGFRYDVLDAFRGRDAK